MDVPNNGEPVAGGKSILLIEDEEALASALKLKLGAVGYAVSVAGTGQDGYDQAVANKFDLIILDLILPVMDGFTVLAKLKEQNVKSPVLVLSNLSQQEDMDKVKALGAIDFLVKSNVQLSQILDYIKKIL